MWGDIVGEEEGGEHDRGVRVRAACRCRDLPKIVGWAGFVPYVGRTGADCGCSDGGWT